MKRVLLVTCGVLALVCSMASPSFAQESKGEIAGGWQFLHSFEDELDDVNLPKGFFVEGAGHLTPMFSVIGEYAANFKNVTEAVTEGGISVSASADVTLQTFMGGIRVGRTSGESLRPFGQVLLGGVRASADVSVEGGGLEFSESDSNTEFGVDFGAGVDFKLSGGVGARAKATYLHSTGDGGGNGFRFQLGVVVPF
jgi:opacity protein-like surface antigen